MLMVMSLGYMRALSLPILGWSPLPLKRPGGSTLKLPTYTQHVERITDTCMTAALFQVTAGQCA